MATSSGINLFQPVRIWLITSVALVGLFVFWGTSLYHKMKAANQQALQATAQGLLHTRLEQMQTGKLRELVEASGLEQNNLSLELLQPQYLAFGKRTTKWQSFAWIRDCTAMKISSGAHLQLCRFERSPILWLLGFGVAVLLLLFASFRWLLSLERNTVDTFYSFMRERGLKVPERGSLRQLLLRLEDLGTELHAAETQRLETSTQKARADLALQVAHDLRGPLSVLESSWNSDKILATDALLRLRTLADEVLRERRPSGSIVLPDTSLKESLQFLAADLQARHGERARLLKISGTVTVFPRIPDMVLRRALANFLDNAINFAQSEVLLSISVVEEQVILSVQDDGLGISATLLSQLGAGPVASNRQGGSGVGIFSAVKALEEFGATWHIDNLQPGLRVKIQVSMHPAVVLVDNDPLVIELWRRSLQKLGQKLISFSNSESCHACLAEIPTSTPIFLDYDLGAGQDSVGLAKEMRQRGFNKIFLTSGYSAMLLNERLGENRRYFNEIYGKEVPQAYG